MLGKLGRFLKKKIYKSTFDYNFNVPIKFKKKSYFINERLVEIPFTHRNILALPANSEILDFGCTKSWLSLELSAMGYNVTGVDLRDYNYNHPNFQFKKGNILNIHLDKYDAIIALSVIEHIGLGTYGDKIDEDALIQILDKIYELLNYGGLFIFTIPVGKSSINNFERSFTPDEVDKIFEKYNYSFLEEKFFKRKNGKFWEPCSRKAISSVSNDKQTIMKIGTGVNGCGCFVLKKITR